MGIVSSAYYIWCQIWKNYLTIYIYPPLWLTLYPTYWSEARSRITVLSIKKNLQKQNDIGPYLPYHQHDK